MRWHDEFRHVIALQAAEDGTSAQRMTRQGGFIKVAEDQNLQLGGQLPMSLKLNTSDIIFAQYRGFWVPAMILSVWRLYRNGNATSQLSAVELPRGCVHSARAVILEVDSERTATCDVHSKCHVFSLKQIGVNCAASDLAHGLDGFRCKLSAETIAALEKLNKENGAGEDDADDDHDDDDDAPAASGKPFKKAAKSYKKAHKKKEIISIVENFTRYTKGKALVAQEIGKLVALDAVMFPKAPLLHPESAEIRCPHTYNDQPLTLQGFLDKSGAFMSVWFGGIRNRLEYFDLV
jgi:hypothetical protein